jgi:hypothetical protein
MGIRRDAVSHYLKNHVLPVRFWPSAQSEFSSKFEKGVRPR